MSNVKAEGFAVESYVVGKIKGRGICLFVSVLSGFVIDGVCIVGVVDISALGIRVAVLIAGSKRRAGKKHCKDKCADLIFFIFILLFTVITIVIVYIIHRYPQKINRRINILHIFNKLCSAFCTELSTRHKKQKPPKETGAVWITDMSL